MVKIAVLGGGIAGLSAAYFLERKFQNFAEVHLYEKNFRVGGWLQTEQWGPHHLETGARTIRPFGREYVLFPLIQELELAHEILLPSENAKQRYLFLDGKLRKAPNSIKEALTSPFFWKFFPALLTEWAKKPSSLEDETIGAFFRRRFGDRITENFVDSIVSGIYAGDIDQLSMKSCFPFLYQMEGEMGSFTKAMLKRKKSKMNTHLPEWQKAPLWTFKNGMETLVNALQSAIRGRIFLAETIEELKFDQNSARVRTNQREEQYHFIVSALPSPQLSDLLPDSEETLKGVLSSIPFTSVATAHLCYDEPLLQQEGFGHLVPSKEDKEVMGVVWDSSAFGKEGTKLSVMMGGARFPDVASHSKPELLSIANRAVKRMLGIDQTPSFEKLVVARDAIPQYTLGHEERLKKLFATLQKTNPRLHVIGSSYFGVAVPDCIASAHMLVSNLQLTPEPMPV